MSSNRSKIELAVAIDPGSTLSKQHQLRQKLIDAMNRGVLLPGRRLPSSRQLAQWAGVSRNTVTLAYDALLAEGHLVSRPRSGVYVADGVHPEPVALGRRVLDRAAGPAPVAESGSRRGLRRPPEWEQYPYPFIEGCTDASLAPVDEWREAFRLAFAKQAIVRWSTSAGEQDDPLLVEELRTQWLPAWGVNAGPDELLVAASFRNGFYLTIDSVVKHGAPVLIADPIDPDARRLMSDRQANIRSLPDGFDLADAVEQMPAGGVAIVAAHRFSGLDAKSRERAHALLRVAAARDALIVEFAEATDLHESRRAGLSLRAVDTYGRVVFVSGLSALASVGTPPGLINGEPRIIDRTRRLRTSMGSELAAGMQRAWSYFLGLGHYRACMARAHRVLQPRRTALRDALNHYLHRFVTIEPLPGRSAYRVTGPPGMNARELARSAQSLGVLIDPAPESEESNVFYMGVSSLPKESIRAGVELLARLIRGDRKLGARRLQEETIQPLDGAALNRELSGVTLLYSTVYGEPCTIEVRADGVLVGRAGYANEDRDVGRWWIENDRWHRQWEHWAYGEASGYITAIDGDQIRWFNSDGLLVDTALIVRTRRRRA